MSTSRAKIPENKIDHPCNNFQLVITPPLKFDVIQEKPKQLYRVFLLLHWIVRDWNAHYFELQ